MDLLCAILRDEPFEWPDLHLAAAERLFDRARHHGVHLLVADRVWRLGRMDTCPAALREWLVTAIHNQVAVTEIADRELRRVLAALSDSGITPLLFKGAALAYTHYTDPALRPRLDTDLLVDVSEVASAFAVLERLEYRRPSFATGDFVAHQVPYVKTDARGVQHAIDVHWKISNPQVFAGALTYEEIRAHASGIPALGDSARAAGAIHALALACIHRAAHHPNEERLIWLYDIHLLAERLGAAEQEAFVDLAQVKQLTAVCADALASAERCFHGTVAGVLSTRLMPRGSSPEPSQVYVTGRMRKVDVLLSDLNALPRWGQRVKLLREHVFPPRTYMREVYGVSSPVLLPLFYALRFARGARQWFRRR